MSADGSVVTRQVLLITEVDLSKIKTDLQQGILPEYGVNVIIQENARYCTTLLAMAIKATDKDLVTLLLQQDAHYDRVHWRRRDVDPLLDVKSALSVAVNTQDESITRLVLAQCKIDINRVYKERNYSYTVLGEAVDDDNRVIIDLLLSCGADPNIPSVNNFPQSAPSVWHAKSVATMTRLVQAGADLKNTTQSEHGTLLHLHCVRENLDIVKYLLAAGLDVNAQTSQGQTPLHLALESNETTHIITALIRSGANEHALDSKRQSPMMLAQKLSKYKPELLQALQEAIKHSEFKKQTVVLPNAAPVSLLTQALKLLPDETQTIKPICSDNIRTTDDNNPCQKVNDLERAVNTIVPSSTDTDELTMSNEDSPAIFNNLTRSQPIACPSYQPSSSTHFKLPRHTYAGTGNQPSKSKQAATDRPALSH